MITLALSFAALVSPEPCDATVKAAVAFVDDSDPRAAEAVEGALTRGCFELVDIKAGSDDDMLAAAKDAGAPWLFVARAGLVQALQDRIPGTLFSVDVTALDAQTGARRGRAMRSANVMAEAPQAPTTREAVRVLDDAVHVLRNQLTPAASPAVVVPVKAAACTAKRQIVLLWNKNSDAAGRDAVLHALATRCIEAPDQFDSDRAAAVEFARDLKRPLVAVKTSIARPSGGVVSHVLTMSADIVDANADELKVLAHAADSRNALHASDDADAWSKVEVSLVGNLLDKVLPAP